MWVRRENVCRQILSRISRGSLGKSRKFAGTDSITLRSGQEAQRGILRGNLKAPLPLASPLLRSNLIFMSATPSWSGSSVSCLTCLLRSFLIDSQEESDIVATIAQGQVASNEVNKLTSFMSMAEMSRFCCRESCLSSSVKSPR